MKKTPAVLDRIVDKVLAYKPKPKSNPAKKRQRRATTELPDTKAFTSPDKIAEAGERLYSEKYKTEYEKKYSGQFVAIEVSTGKPFVAKYPEEALEAGRKAVPAGIFHLIRVGSAGAFRVSYASHGDIIPAVPKTVMGA